MTTIAPESIKLSKLPSIPLEWHKALPAVSGIYIVLNKTFQVLYVGHSKNLQKRWMKHHLKKQLLEMGGVRLAWIELQDVSLLEEKEYSLIGCFHPPFNYKTDLPKRRSREVLPELTMHCRLAVFMAKRIPPLTQKQLAKDTGLSPTTINQLYQNKFTRIDVDTVDAICKYFNCEVGELFVLKKKDNPHSSPLLLKSHHTNS